MTQKQIAVIGGGVVGVCTAYFLAGAGHEVAVIERHQNVAQENSFANAGLVAPGLIAPWAVPGMPGRILSRLFSPTAPAIVKPAFARTARRWIRKWLAECELEHYRANKMRMQRLAFYSLDILQQLREYYQLDYEQTRGVLQLFRTEKDRKMAEPALAILAESGVPHQLLDADAARMAEPALAHDTPLAGALHLPQDEAGNCPLFTKRLKQIAASMGVQFHFSQTVRAIESDRRGVLIRTDDQSLTADAVVVAAGVESARLLEPLGIRIPLHAVKTCSATAPVKDFEQTPHTALIDESYKVTITRMGNRIRLSGTAEFAPEYSKEPHQRAVRTLKKCGMDWFPNAANYDTAHFWSSIQPMLPDGAPLLGATHVPNVYLNIGHGSGSWAMALGSGRVLADMLSGFDPEIDMDGLTLARYG